MIGPTWADVASQQRKTESREVKWDRKNLWACPFCKAPVSRKQMSRVTGHRCGCGALFYAQQAVAVHFKERE